MLYIHKNHTSIDFKKTIKHLAIPMYANWSPTQKEIVTMKLSTRSFLTRNWQNICAWNTLSPLKLSLLLLIPLISNCWTERCLPSRERCQGLTLSHHHSKNSKSLSKIYKSITHTFQYHNCEEVEHNHVYFMSHQEYLWEWIHSHGQKKLISTPLNN